MKSRKKLKLNINYSFIIIAGIILVSFLTIVFIGKYILTLKNIKLYADFSVDKDKLFQYLEISKDKGILNYNSDLMKKKLSKLLYLKNYDVSMKFPNTLYIILQTRIPLAKVIGADNKLFFIDDSGLVYKEAINDFEKNPTIIFKGTDKINIGVIIGGKFNYLINEISLLKTNFHDIYDSISQFEVFDDNNNITYKIYFRTINHCVYLKNFINVDCISKGLAGALYFDSLNIKEKKMIYTNNAFEIM